MLLPFGRMSAPVSGNAPPGSLRSPPASDCWGPRPMCAPCLPPAIPRLPSGSVQVYESRGGSQHRAQREGWAFPGRASRDSGSHYTVRCLSRRCR